MRLSRTIASKSFLANPHCRIASILAVLGVILVSASVFSSGRASSSGGNAVAIARARLGDSVTTGAAGRGKPWINMTDGHELVTTYKGSNELVGVLARDQARPLSLASGDFDEDGMPDLATGYALAGSGLVTLQRGNVDSVYPYTPEARQRRASGDFTNAPFLSPAAVFDTAAVPEIFLQGDFNADGHADLIAAARGSETIHVLAGDGRGNLAPAQDLSLPGKVTAITSGEINRADGLADLVVAIEAADGPKLMVFEGPEGAVKATAELLSLPSAATDLELGYVGVDHVADVAVAAGNELLIVHGRDRKLSLDEETRAAVPRARISRRSFSSPLISLAIGDFTGGPDLDLAVMLDDGSVQLISAVGGEAQSLSSRLHSKAITLAAGLRTRGGQLFCARVSSLSHENLVMVNRESNQLHVWMDDEERRARGDAGVELSSRQPSPPVTFDTESDPVAVLPMRLNTDALSDLVVLRAGHMSPSVLTSQSAMTIVVCTTQDCDECPGGATSLRNAIAIANGSQGLDTIKFSNQFSGIPTITLQNSLPAITEALDIGGTAAASCSNPNEADFTEQSANGIGLDGGNSVNNGFNFTGGGIRIADFVIGRFTSNGLQVTTNSGNMVEGNFIGLASDGSTPRRNGTGVRITSRANMIGGTVSAASNVISSNGTGVMFDGVNADDNQVRNNRFGTTANGQFLRGNSQFAVSITNGAARNTIGGSFVGTANDIFGSGLDGVFVSAANSNTIQRNDIVLHNRNGVSIVSGAGNLIGGTNDIVRNNIVSNTGNGVEINGSGATDNLVQRNFVGLAFDSIGNPIDQGNGSNGIALTANPLRNSIGGALDAAGNFIALNNGNGVLVSSGNQNKILSNRIFNNGDLPIRLNPGANENQVPPVFGSATLVNTPAPNGVTPTARMLAAGNLTVTLSLTGTPGQTYTLDLYLYSRCECTGDQVICLIPFPLGQKPALMDGTGRFSGAFTFSVPPPDNFTSYGFVNATATSPSGSTSQFAQCVLIGAATNCAPTCPANPAPVQATSASGAVVSYPAATLPTNCTGVSVACAPASGTTFPVGTTTVTCTATDAVGSRGTCSFSVTVTPQSSCAPICPASPAPVQATSSSGAVVTYPAATLPANCSGVTVTCAPGSGTTFPIGTTTVTCTATDASGTRGTCSFGVTVTPQSSCAPICPASPAPAQATSASGAVVGYSAPTLPANCSGVNVTCVPPSGATFPVGRTTVTCTASDASGSRGTCSFAITVNPLGLADFSLSFEQSTVTGLIGTKARFTVLINRTGGFTGAVTVIPAPKSNGVKAKPPDPITTTDSSAFFKYKVAEGLIPETRQLTFTGVDSTGRTRTATATLILQ